MSDVSYQIDTPPELAKFLKISLALVRKWTRLTDIPHIKVGRVVRFDRNEVLAWLKARQLQNCKAAQNRKAFSCHTPGRVSE